ncbi:MAG: hypothetical protein M1821_003484 [Bathelium mastoideum]|nr:MAG: hypothetical protein M1821_003484 [Bathelium mastoideum]KAI9682568.1 MAG: hypothetical protein M1822_006866 [Bathelium mastoideum]
MVLTDKEKDLIQSIDVLLQQPRIQPEVHPSRPRSAHPSETAHMAGQNRPESLTEDNLAAHNAQTSGSKDDGKGVRRDPQNDATQADKTDPSPMDRWMQTQDDYALWMKVHAGGSQRQDQR